MNLMWYNLHCMGDVRYKENHPCMGMHINNDDMVALWCLFVFKCSWYFNQV
jgi:hypothetical protein